MGGGGTSGKETTFSGFPVEDPDMSPDFVVTHVA